MAQSPRLEPTQASKAQLFVAALKRADIKLVATLPDVWMGGLVTELASDPDIALVRVAREDEGVGICAGAFLGGGRSAVLAQNAGLLLSVNTLAGLALHHQIPVLLLVINRGGRDDDQYYQVYKGRVTVPVIEALGLPYHFVNGPDEYHVIEEAARQCFLARAPVVVLLSRRALLETP